ncbi:hypothetical protein F4780DRAFT_474900 [Xylariomycetidae sp. FL0641]|nr:hypothetical protein F4780DRAFT_474900 [Xylariomycetidae sp. FL0641]
MTDNLNPVPVPRKRRRLAKSCEPCRSRKIRCDRGFPCKPCKRSRAALSCCYKPDGFGPVVSSRSDEARGPASRGGDQASSRESHQSSAEEHPSQRHPPTSWNGAGQRHDAGEPRLPVPGSELRRAPAATASDDLADRVARLERLLTSPKEEDPARGRDSALSVTLPRPHLRLEHEKTRLFGQSHWLHSLEHVHLLLVPLQHFHIVSYMQARGASATDGAQNELVSEIKEAARARRSAKKRDFGSLQDLMPGLPATIPSRAVCDRAYRHYLRTFEPVFRILHVPSFQREYASYWSQPDGRQNAFLMKLLMILVLGSIFLSDRAEHDEIRSHAREWAYVVQWWLTGPTECEAMGLDGIQVFCLLTLARQAHSLGGTASIATDALLKLSFTVGLHLDPRNFTSISPLESELRRRLWITVLELTTITSMNSTLPLLVRPDDFQMRMPSNRADKDLEGGNDETHAVPIAAQATPVEGITDYTALDCSLQLLLARSLRLRMQVVRLLNSGAKELSFQEALGLGDSLKAQCRNIAAFFDANVSSPAVSGHNDSAFHQKFLDSYLRRIVLLLHRPFAIQARNDARFFIARKICLEASIIVAEHAHAMDLACGQVDDFCRLCMTGSGLFKASLSQDVICGLTFEIMTQLEEEEGAGPRDGKARSSPSASDPLARMAQAGREPLMRILEHMREQWRHIIKLGRPSLKQYIFLSWLLGHIKAQQAGQDPGKIMFASAAEAIKECKDMLNDYKTSAASSAAWSWSEDTSPHNLDTMGLFGFDFSTLVSHRWVHAPFLPRTLADQGSVRRTRS